MYLHEYNNEKRIEMIKHNLKSILICPKNTPLA